MDWRHYVREHLPPLNVSAEREIEIVDELAGQLETTFERARANGATEDEAMRRARAEVPDWDALAQTLGRIERPFAHPLAAGASSGGLMTGLIQDLRYAVRALKRAPGFAAVSIITLALGIAATTIVYSIVDGILLRPLPIEDADRVMLARETINGQDMSVAWPNFQDWQKRQTSFGSLAAWRGLTANLTGVEQPRRLNVRHVTWELFSIFGVRPIIGRDFTPDDDRPGVPRTALVSYAFWQRQLGGTPDALGRQIMLDETPVTVIGVLPRDFTIARQEDIFLPVGTFLEGPVLQMYNGRGNHFGFSALGRLKPGVTLETASTEMVTIARQLEQEYPATNSGNGASVEPLFEVLVADARQMLYVLFGAVITMLLIACVNLANLMLSRAAGRAQEMAVRRSLGAARWRHRAADADGEPAPRRHRRHAWCARRLRGFRGARRPAASFPAAHPHRHHRLARRGGLGPGVNWHWCAVRTDARDPGRHRAIDDVAPQRARHRHRANQRRHAADPAAGRGRARARARHRRRPDVADDEQSRGRGDGVPSP